MKVCDVHFLPSLMMLAIRRLQPEVLHSYPLPELVLLCSPRAKPLPPVPPTELLVGARYLVDNDSDASRYNDRGGKVTTPAEDERGGGKGTHPGAGEGNATEGVENDDYVWRSVASRVKCILS
jgi:hypothetical protein